MIAPMLDLSRYGWNPFAIPPLVTSVALMGLAVIVVWRERGSRISGLFCLATWTITHWQLAFTLMYLAGDAEVALGWAKAAYFGVPLIPAAMYHFAVRVTGAAPSSALVVRLGWAGSLLFVALIVSTDLLIGGVYHYWWGYYPRYGWLSVPYLIFFFGLLIASLHVYVSAFRASEPGSPRRRRLGAFLCAFGILYLGSCDYLAKYGIPLYPFGYLPVLVFLALTARTIVRYRLVDITPALAAQPILETMTEPVLVLDLEGTIRLANRAACDLLGRPGHLLRGERVGAAVPHPALQTDVHTWLRPGMAAREYEVAYVRPSGELRTLTVSISPMQDADARLVAAVCFLKDITARRRAEATFTQLARLAEDWTRVQRPAVAEAAKPDAARWSPKPLATPRPPWVLGSGGRCFAALVLTLVGPMLLIIWLQARQIQRTLDAAARRHTAQTAQLLAQAVQKHFDGLSRYVESYASRPVLLEAVAGQDRAAMSGQLQELLAHNAAIDRAMVSDAAGVLLADAPSDPAVLGRDFSSRDWYRGVSQTQQTFVSDVYERAASPQKTLVGIVTPIAGWQGTVGYLLAQHTVEALTGWLLERSPVAAGLVVLLDRQGRLALVHESEASGRTDVLLEHAQRLRSGTVRLRDPAARSWHYLSAATIPSCGWTVVVCQTGEIGTIGGSLRRIAMGLAVIGAMAMLVLGIVWWLAVVHYHRLVLAVGHTNERYFVDMKQLLAERTHAEAALRQLSFILESSKDAIIGKRLDTTIFYWNKAAERLYGYTTEDAKGRTSAFLDVPGMADQLTDSMGRAVRGETIDSIETVRMRKDGSQIDVAITLSPIKDAEGHVVGVSTISRDITQRKRTERELRRAHSELERSHQALRETQLQLIQAAKLESVGRLAAGVAHEVKNPLAVLLTGVELLVRTVSPVMNGRVSGVLTDMRSAVGRADAVVKGLLDFSVLRELTIQSEDVRAVIAQALLLVKHELDRRHVTVTQPVTGALPPVPMDRQKIEQVFVNVFMNAIQAMPGGGALTVAASYRRLTAAEPCAGRRRTDSLRIGDEVVALDIDDTGTGIPPAKLAKVFDPFFTTKPTGQGTGLGLTVTRRILDLHGGGICVANRPEGGARVTLWLPVRGGEGNGQAADSHRG